MDLKGTQSEKNVLAAFAGESQARNRYTFFAEQARSEGRTEIAELFERMAKNETTHAKIWFQLLYGGLGDTAANLQQAAAGENGEWMDMYPSFAKQAREDGFEKLAQMFEKVAEIERDHERTFMKTFVALQQERQDQPAAAAPPKQKKGYRCMFCGAVFENRPDVCAVCQAIGSFEQAMIDI